ncbi:hypothetical protein FIBSPDRAFT_324431 [Athelia psychrophila]|uniref:Uncharacterized protein n=1 Tax=Athelia psychrophila TaxID=1759441 RepID=A0A167WNF0_9AGAM|nr:hypothetical protein FIBSPDRAFT_324431 [Fibularhizoctonia sp. CBS 109695]
MAAVRRSTQYTRIINIAAIAQNCISFLDSGLLSTNVLEHAHRLTDEIGDTGPQCKCRHVSTLIAVSCQRAKQEYPEFTQVREKLSGVCPREISQVSQRYAIAIRQNNVFAD